MSSGSVQESAPLSGAAGLEAARKEYAELRARGLSLDLTRGKPSPEQLDLAGDLLSLPGAGDVKAADGTDTRNYGGLLGLPELREIFSGPLQVPAGQLLALGNASLTLMHDNVVQALLSVVPGGERRWADEPRVRFVCPVPGYDRHFGVCERYGIDMVPVPLTGEGPDMDVVEELVASDPTIKGMWCVPKYSNPTGEVYSDETVRRLAAMRTAAPDFRLFWDNAYAVHHLTGERVEILSILDACAEAGNPDRAFVFGSTSKITTAGSGVAFVGSSPANVAWMKERLLKQTIGPDKVNQLRHVRFFRDTDGVTAHMERHRALLEPRFAAVYEVLESELGPLGIAEWTRPKGGYFVSLDVPDGCASEVVRLAKEAGIALTPAGAAFPYGKDPRDREIRLAPSFPSVEEVREAMRAVAVCVRLAAAEQEAAGTAG
ncbi:aminotransferase class I/II-fold pyridoxal phosphate-dependent enzyme [Streptomyces sp. WAC 00631]|uniref:aminotransferase class I/II-fold pyridoxal phosphate-dependent enzyme n=1 Tax=unclassified Streptomyces TaxID=2593676 RepID=UPI001E5750D2|nr:MULTISPECIES: aminotransferase class I/II-fold pyridoxal phosphate-dependent enzyme [unclassified Streptomyces]MCC5033705.1 aminotransferase class I/II-fold pyridoxal phosphate-dependent enzyme [Streptomyces sp. WAC 00631]MCC9742905.1 aminotransferase class I/II-fold pyridoxal phosphate-dependent enzyme [Streptomyces sp. MNU89]